MDPETARRLLDLTVEYRQTVDAGLWSSSLDLPDNGRGPDQIAAEVAALLSGDRVRG